MTDTLYGLNRYRYNPLTEMGFTNFQWVVPGKLARSSQPGYNQSDDTVQSYSMVQIMFLKLKGIRCIISANELGITAESQRLLTNANIVHHHYSVEDGTPPTAFQLQNAANVMQQAMAAGGGVLVHCGYGQGRTGAFVAGWAMLKCFNAGDHHRQMSRDEMCNSTFMRDNFGVERDTQVAAVRAAAALPALPTTAPSNTNFANFGSAGSWAPPITSNMQLNNGDLALGSPNAVNGTLTFANFNDSSGSSSDIDF